MSFIKMTSNNYETMRQTSDQSQSD